MSLLNNEMFQQDLLNYVNRQAICTTMTDRFDRWLFQFVENKEAPLIEGLTSLVAACESSLLFNDILLSLWTRLKNADESEDKDVLAVRDEIIKTCKEFGEKYNLENKSPESYFVHSLRYVQKYWIRACSIFRITLDQLNDDSAKEVLAMLDEIEEVMFPMMDKELILKELTEADLLFQSEDFAAYYQDK